MIPYAIAVIFSPGPVLSCFLRAEEIYLNQVLVRDHGSMRTYCESGIEIPKIADSSSLE